ncbi:class I SAM-dependent methyltransferase [Endothiovibrio diazotrophicus]
MDRNEKLLSAFPAGSRGLEIGALCHPLVSEGEYDVRYVDWTSTDALRAKYANDPNVDVDKIVTVHYTLQEGHSLRQIIGDDLGDGFDFVIASHVIEHVPNPIGWFREIAGVLRPGGFLSLAIPDQRYIFDCKRELTGAGRWIDAFHSKQTRPSLGDIYDHFSNYVEVPLANFENLQFDPDTYPETHFDREWIKEALLRDESPESYIDCHCTTYTPFSFTHLLKEVMHLGLCDFRVHSFYETERGGTEFVVVLERMREGEPNGSGISEQLASLPDVTRHAGEWGWTDLHGYIDAQRLREKELEERIGTQEGELAELGSALAARDRDLEATRSELEKFRRLAERQHESLREILSSRSWRITAPLRWCVERFRHPGTQS